MLITREFFCIRARADVCVVAGCYDTEPRTPLFGQRYGTTLAAPLWLITAIGPSCGSISMNIVLKFRIAPFEKLAVPWALGPTSAHILQLSGFNELGFDILAIFTHRAEAGRHDRLRHPPGIGA